MKKYKKYKYLIISITIITLLLAFTTNVFAAPCDTSNDGSGTETTLEPIYRRDPQHLQPSNKKEVGFETASYFNTSGENGPISSTYYLYSDATVNVYVKDDSGNIIATISQDESKTPGGYTITWDGRDTDGNIVGSENYRIVVVDSNNSDVFYHIDNIIIDDTPPVAQLTGMFVEDIDDNGTDEILIFGTATDANLDGYEIIYSPDISVDMWESYMFDGQEIEGDGINSGILAALGVSPPSNTEYGIKLIVEDKSGNISEAFISGLGTGEVTNALEININNISLGENLGALNTTAYPDKPEVWLEDSLPTGVETPVTDWEWNSNIRWNGAFSHTDAGGPGTKYHYFIHPDEPFIIGDKNSFNVNIIQYVYLDPVDPPEQIMLQFYTGVGNGEQRVYWGDDLIDLGGVDGTVSRLRMDPLPPVGQWIRLKIPASALNLEGKAIKGITFATYGGKAYWDKTTTSSDFVEIQQGSYEVVLKGDDNSSPATIRYTLSKDAAVSLHIYDANGNPVRTLIDNEIKTAGYYEITWDNLDDSGDNVSNGTYIYQFSTPDGPIDSDDLLRYDTALDGSNLAGIAPSKVAVDSQNNVYVINDADNNIYKFDSNGNQLNVITPPGLPAAIAVDSGNNLYTAGIDNLVVSKYDSAGIWLNDIVSPDALLGSASSVDVAIGPADKVYIISSLSSTLRIYLPDGTLETSINIVQDDPLTIDIVEGPEFLPTLVAIDVDFNGNFYLLDSTQHTILKYSDTGSFGKTISKFGSSFGMLDNPADLAVDANGNIYVADSGNKRVQKFDSNGFFLTEIGVDRNPDSNDLYLMDKPTGLSFDKYGNLYVADSVGGKVEQINVARGAMEIESIVARIISPVHNSLVAGGVAIQGTASAYDFQKYTVEWGWGENPVSWNRLIESYSEMDNDFKFEEHAAQTVGDELAVFDINGILNGIWDSNTYNSFGVTTVKLTVYTNDGRTAEERVTITWGGVVLTTSPARIISSDNKVFFTIPANGVNTIGGLVFSIAPSGDPKLDTVKLKKIGEYYEFRPPGLPFVKTASLEMNYSNYDIDFDQDGIVDVDENRLAIYEWNPSLQEWKYLGGDVNLAGNYITVDIKEIPYGEAYYAIFADVTKINPPIIYQPSSPTDQEIITLFGVSEPGSLVEIFVNDISQGYAVADGTTGSFMLSGVRLNEGSNSINGQARDALDDISVKSQPIELIYQPPLPIDVTSINFMTPDYSAPYEGTVKFGDSLFIELVGSDNNSSEINTVYIHAKGNYTDTIGFELSLVETSLNTGVYRGMLDTNHETRIGSNIIGVIPGEVVTISSVDKPAFTDSINILDDVPPARPEVTSATHPNLVQNYFEDNLGEWENRSGGAGGSVLFSDTATFAGEYSAMIINEVDGGDMGVVMRSTSYNAKDYPLVSFAYKIGPDVKTNIMVSVDDVWYEIVFTDDAKHVEDFERVLYTTIGSLNVTADGAWHESEFNLYTMLKNLMPDKTDFEVKEMIMAEWDNTQWSVVEMGGNNKANAAYYIDNFVISGRNAGSTVSFDWSGLTDISGVVGYSYLIDNIPDTMPDDIIEGFATEKEFTGLVSGTHYFHIIALDGAGNWSKPGHYKFKVDLDKPSADMPEPGINEHSSNSEISLRITDGSGMGIDIDSLKIEVEGNVYDLASKGITYNPITEILNLKLWKILPTPPPIVDAQVVDVVLVEARDLAGNQLQETFAWSWIADYSSLSKGNMVLMTTGGGYTPTWSPDGDNIAFMSKRDGDEHIYVMSSDDFVEENNSIIRLTLTGEGINNSQPAWSPVDNRIAFVSDRDGSSDIWMIFADGTGLSKLTLDDYDNAFEDTHPSWSPDGSQIVFSRDGAIWKMFADGTGSELLARDGIFKYIKPEWSKDGEKIVFVKALYENHVWLMDADGQNEVQLTGTNQNRAPSWMTGSSEVLYENNSEIWSVKADGSENNVFIDNSDRWKDTEPQWTPVAGDSRMLFQSTRNGAWNIWLMTVLEVRDISAEPGAFSPNGDNVNDLLSIKYNPSISNIKVDLKIYDSSNNLIRTLVDNEIRSQGEQVEIWDGLDDLGNLVGDGLYTFELVVSTIYRDSQVEENGNVRVDNTAPTTASSYSYPYYAKDSTIYVTSETKVYLNAVDTNGSGVSSVEYSIDNGSSWIGYNTPLTFADPGAMTLLFKSSDNSGNIEPEKRVQLFVDNTPPESRISEINGLHSDGTNYFAIATQIYTLLSEDIESGVGKMYIKQPNANNFSLYSSPITLNNSGINIIQYYSLDNLGNAESVKSVNVIVDDEGPVTSISTVGDVFFNGIDYYALTTGSYELSAIDTSSGVNRIEVSIDSGEYIPYASAITFGTTGSHTIVARAMDNAGNQGNIITFAVNVTDELPTTVMNPSDDLFVASYYASLDYSFSFETASASIEVNIDGAGFVSYTAPISFTTEGLHTIEYRGVKADGSYEPTSSFEVFLDGTSPTTQINLDNPAYSTNPTYLTSNNMISLTSNDAASGVERIEYSINSTSAWTTYSEPFNLLSEGAVVIYYRGIDNVNNIESTRSINVFIDNTPPILNDISPGGPLYVFGEISFAPADLAYSISANDTASGLARIKIKIDDGIEQSYSNPFTLSEGRHEINYSAIDNLGHTSVEKLFVVNVDGSTPISSVIADLPAYGTGPIYITNLTNIFISSDDGTGSGTDSIEYRFNEAGEWSTYTVPFKVSSANAETLQYRSKDHVGNQESEKSIELISDLDAPQTAILFGDPNSGAAPVYIKPNTSISLSADDASGSGIEFIEYRVDANNWDSYDGEFFVTYPGAHNIYFRSVDNIGNMEPVNSLSVFVDVVPPDTTLTPDNAVYTDGQKLYAYPSLNSFSLSAVDGDSGVSVINVNVDNAGFTEYLTPIIFSSVGSHNIKYRSVDNLGNEEDISEYNIEVVDVMPLVAIQAEGVIYEDKDGNKYAPSSTSFKLSETGISDLDRIEYQIDAAGYVTYTDAISIDAEGLHSIAYRAVVNSVVQDFSTYIVTIDNTSPSTTAEIGTPKYDSGTTLYLSLNTPVTLVSEDNLSGIAKTMYSMDNGISWVRYGNTPFNFQSGGTFNLKYYSEDNAGNIETQGSITVVADNTPPEVVLTPAGVITVQNENNYAPLTYEYVLSAKDNEAGIDHIEVNVDGAGYVAYTNPISFNTGGLHQIQYKAVNNLNMWSEVKSFAVIVQDSTVSISTTIVPSETVHIVNSNNIVSGRSTFTFQVESNSELLDHIEYSLDSGDFVTYSAPVGPFDDGAHEIVYRSIDNLNNVEANNTYRFVVDATPPEITNMTASPNPFTPNSELNIGVDDVTSIYVRLSDNIFDTVRVVIDIYDMESNLIRNLVEENDINGDFATDWDGKDDNGNYLSEGHYIYKVTAADRLNNSSEAEGTVTSVRLLLENRISKESADQINPDISEETVVWQDYRNGNWDIYLYDYKTDTEKQITYDLSDQTLPTVYGNRVVWQDDRNGNSDIYLYDIDTGLTVALTKDLFDQIQPSIHGNYIVWTDYSQGNADIYLYDFNSGSGSMITANNADQVNPSIYGTIAVWEDYRNANADIYAYDIQSGEEIQITDNISDQTKPSIYGSRIVWEDNRNGNSDLYLYDLVNNTEIQLNISDANQTNPVIFMDAVAYQDDSSGASDPDIYIYNITSGYKIHVTTDISRQEKPAFYGNRIVWQDDRNGNWDIYGALLSSMKLDINIADQNLDSKDQIDPAIYNNIVTYTLTNGDYSDIYMRNLTTGEDIPAADIETALQSRSDIYGKYMVWQDDRNGNWDIYLYNIDDSMERRITTDLADQQNPSIYGDNIVWQDDRNGDWDIYLYNITTTAERRVTLNSGNQINPVIYGDNIVWQDDRNGNWDIYLYDLVTLREQRITYDNSDQTNPDIFNQTVVWEDNREGLNIYIYNLITDREEKMFVGSGNQSNPSIFGYYIVFENDTGGNKDISIYNIANNRLTLIASNTWSEESPVLYENRIAWQGNESDEWSIYTAEMSTVAPTDNSQPAIEDLKVSNSFFSPESSPGVKDSTEISFSISDNISEKLKTMVEIFDSSSNLVRTVMDINIPIGNVKVDWDGKDNNGNYAGEGVYLIVINTQDNSLLDAIPQSISVIVDDTLPTINIQGVIDGETYVNEVTPIVIIEDISLNTTSITLNGNPFISGTTITEGGDYTLAVEASDSSGNRNIKEISFNLSIVAIDLLTGTNLIGYPASVPDGHTSYDLLQQLGSKVTSIQRFDPISGTFQTTSWFSNNPAGVRFNIVNGEGYFVYTKEDSSKSFDGLISCPTIDLNTGLNIVSIPCAPDGYTSYDLLQDIGVDNIESILRLEPVSRTFQKTYYNSGVPSGDRFNIVNGEGYLLYMKTNKTGWNP